MNNSETNIEYICPIDDSKIVPWEPRQPTVQRPEIDMIANSIEPTELQTEKINTGLYTCTSTGTTHKFKLILDENGQRVWKEATTKKTYPVSYKAP